MFFAEFFAEDLADNAFGKLFSEDNDHWPFIAR
jgi:hypothetical protein